LDNKIFVSTDARCNHEKKKVWLFIATAGGHANSEAFPSTWAY